MKYKVLIGVGALAIGYLVYSHFENMKKNCVCQKNK